VTVSVADVNDANKTAISRSLTAQLNQYVSTAGYFKQVTEYPVRLGEQDVSLKFNMTSLKGHRGIHPGYVPGALLTLTVWIWVNGPIYVDTFDVAGGIVGKGRGRFVSPVQPLLAGEHRQGRLGYLC